MPEDALSTVAEVLAVDEAVTRSSGAAPYGVTSDGFVPKSFARLLSEKLLLTQQLFGADGVDVDLRSGSLLRKLCELTALEDARHWAAAADVYDASFVSSAHGAALSALGAELGLERPFEAARGQVALQLTAPLAEGDAPLRIPRGARLLTPGGHHAATAETVALSAPGQPRRVPVEAFFPGPEHNLDPATGPGQTLSRWHPDDPALTGLFDAERDVGLDGGADPGTALVAIAHEQPLTGGERRWGDARYRQLLLGAPRSLWTLDAVRTAVGLVPGVRRAQVRDALGGLDIYQSIFGNFNFIERLFATERDVASPYYFTILVAPTVAAFWEGEDGLARAIASAVEELRPLGIFPNIERAEEVSVTVRADLSVEGVGLPRGSRAVINASEAAARLKDRLLDRLRGYVEALGFGEPVRAAEATWTLMNEPGVTDVRDLHLVRYPVPFDSIDFDERPDADVLPCGANLVLQANQVAVLVDDPTELTLV